MASKAKKHVAEPKQQSKKAPKGVDFAAEWEQREQLKIKARDHRVRWINAEKSAAAVDEDKAAEERWRCMARGCEDRIMAIDRLLTADELAIKAQILAFSTIPNEHGEVDRVRVSRFAYSFASDVRRFLGREV